MLVLLQRLAVPLGGDDVQLPLTLPLMVGAFAVGLRLDHLVISRSRAALFGLALVAMASLTLLSVVRGQQPSVLSLLLFVLIYLPAICLAAQPEAAAAALRFFVDLMTVAAAVGLLLFGLQFVGVGYVDHVAGVVPKSWLLIGFNTADPIQYGSPIFRSNGQVFLEPSFFSLFLGLAASISIALRHRRSLLWLLLAGIIASGAGNGIVVVGATVIWLGLVGPDRRRLLVLVVPTVVAFTFAAFSPLGSIFLERSSEVSSQNSSSSQRFVQPYAIVLPEYLSSPSSAAVGNGAGSSESYVASITSDPVIVPAAPKLLYEYGMLGALCAGAFLLFLTFRDGVATPWFPGMVLAYFVVNAAVLQSTLAAATFLFLSTLVPGYRSMAAPEPVERRG